MLFRLKNKYCPKRCCFVFKRGWIKKRALICHDDRLSMIDLIIPHTEEKGWNDVFLSHKNYASADAEQARMVSMMMTGHLPTLWGRNVILTFKNEKTSLQKQTTWFLDRKERPCLARISLGNLPRLLDYLWSIKYLTRYWKKINVSTQGIKADNVR